MDESAQIYYFSGTGNSLSIAKDLGSLFKNIGPISIAALMRKSDEIKIEGDVIGFVFPVYFAGVPVFIEEFLERVVFGKINYLFAVTNGGGAFCRTLKIFNKLLERKNKTLNAGFTIGMPGVHPKVAHFIKKSDQEFFDEKTRRIKEISEIILQKKDHALEANLGLLGFLLSYIFFKPIYKESKKHNLDRPCWINGTCKQCGTCEKICPVANIKLGPSGPEWLGKCVNCARCYHFCPNEAIELGDDKMKRYRNPHVEVEELIK